MQWLSVVLTGILSLVFFSGRGGFLIAGYNTMPAREKEKFDGKKLCRVMGAGFGVITLWLLLSALLGDNPPAWFTKLTPVIFLADIAFMLLTANFGCKRKDAS